MIKAPFFAVLALVSLLAAQNPPVPEEPDTRIVVGVNRVDVLFTVSDKKGRFVTDLGKPDFEVFENKKPQNVAPEGFAMRKDDSAMFKAIQAAFDAMKADGTYKKLLYKWHLGDEDITKPLA